MSLVVTTTDRPTPELIKRAQQFAVSLNGMYVARNRQSIARMQAMVFTDIVVIGAEKEWYYTNNQQTPFFFHPNLALVRMKRLEQGKNDRMIDVMGLQAGDSMIDCTLGFGADSLVAAAVVGERGRVIGIEKHPIIAKLTARGMHTYATPYPLLAACLQRITVRNQDAIDFLVTQPNESHDVVYLDPMFETEIEESTNFTQLREAGLGDRVTQEWVDEACRVARKCVVLKDHFRSTVFTQFGFTQYKQKTSKFHYGKITCS